MSWVTEDWIENAHEHLDGITQQVRDLMITLEVMGPEQPHTQD